MIIEIIKKKWDKFFFLIFCVLVSYFLLVQRGVWAFADVGFFYRYVEKGIFLVLSKLYHFSNADGFYIGFDNPRAFSEVLINTYQTILTFIFGSDIAQIIYYLVPYVGCFFFGKKLLELIFSSSSNKSVLLGTFYLTFNPLVLLSSTQFSTSYRYFAIVGFIYFFLKINSANVQWKWGSVFVAMLFSLMLVSYPRLIPIVIIVFAVFLFILYLSKRVFLISFYRIICFFVLMGFVLSPFIVNTAFSVFSEDNLVSNYKEGFNRLEEVNYNFKSRFTNSLSHPGAFTPSSLSYFYNNDGIEGWQDNYAVSQSFEFFKIIQILFNTGVIFLALFISRRMKDKERKIIIIFSIIILTTFFINTLGKFTTYMDFINIHKSILIFLYNDYGFIQFFQVFIYTFIFIFIFDSLRKSSSKTWLLGCVLVYLFFNAIPLLSFHYGLKKIHESEIPKNFRERFVADGLVDELEASLFLPYHWLRFSWAPYFVDMNYFTYSKYSTLLIPNLRLVGIDVANLYNKVFFSLDSEGITNIGLWNVKSIFLFNNLKNSDEHIDAYGLYDIEKRAERAEEDILQNSEFVLKDDNDVFKRYQISQSDRYDFFAYSPGSISSMSSEDFFEKRLLLEEKPVIIDKKAITEISFLPSESIDNDVRVDIKTTVLRPTVHFLKVIRSDVEKSFLIQLNQNYSYAWNVYFVDKDQWEKPVCTSSFQEYEITQNQKCTYRYSISDYFDFSFMSGEKLSSLYHIKGNFLGNLYYFNKFSIPKHLQEKKELYLMVHFDKQKYYAYSLLFSGLVFLFIGLLSFYQFFFKLSKRVFNK